MRDSLDLVLLESQISNDRKAARRTWKIFGLFIIIVVIVSLILAILLSSPVTSSSKRTCASVCTFVRLVIAIIPPLLLWGVTIVMLINWRRRRNKADIVRRSLPVERLPSTTKLSDIQIMLIGVFISGVLGLIFRWDLETILWLLLIYIFIYMMTLTSITLWVRSLLYRATYDEAIGHIQFVRRFFQGNIGLLNLEGLALILAGKASESEQLHRRFIAQAQKTKVYDWLAYNNYGVELTYQGKYAEAFEMLQVTIRLQPHISCGYDSLAYWYLYQNIEPERAIELSQFGLQRPASPFPGMYEVSRSTQFMTLAWAEAKVGNREAAEAKLIEALAKANTKFIRMFADLNRIAGETYLALGETDKARDHFQKAAKIDPKGRIGKLAQAALERLDSDKQ